MIKLKTKISGSFRSKAGAEPFAKIRTIIDSAIRQNIHPFDALENPSILLSPTGVVTKESNLCPIFGLKYSDIRALLTIKLRS